MSSNDPHAGDFAGVVPAQHPVDGGPVYTETRFDRLVAEPFNAASAVLFLFVALHWWRRVWPKRHEQRLIVWAAPILAIGGVGGTLYHAFRVWRGFLLMDFLPIVVLTLMSGAYFARQHLGSWWRVAALLLPVVAAPQVFFYLAREGVIALPLGMFVNLSYAVLGLIAVGPLTWVTLRYAYRHWRWLPLTIGSFALALGCRAADRYAGDVLPIGTHWLWHVFGAVATAAILELVYRVNQELAAAKAA
jgi:hypothetical protein